MNDCVQCQAPVEHHLLRGGNSFTLWCPDGSGRALETLVSDDRPEPSIDLP